MKNILIILLSIIILVGGGFLVLKEDAPSEIIPDQTNNLEIESNGSEKEEPTDSSESKTNNYVVVDTGQTSCYNDSTAMNCPSAGDYFGQDAQYITNTPRYQDNNDGTVTDLNTGLMWIQDAGNKESYYPAIKNAQNFSFAGYDDWRVPTIKELYSLMDFKGIDPSAEDADSSGLTPFIDTGYFDFEYGDPTDGSRIIDSQWITSSIYVSTVMNNNECFFGVNFADGRIKCYPTQDRQGKGFFIRLVRGNTSYGKNDFQNNNDGTINDLATGLMWQTKDNGEGMLWNEALAYCEDLSLAGENDWRLPDIKELQSLVDYSRSPDTTNSPALNPLFSATQITNEAGQKDWGYYWSSTTHKSHVNASPTAYISFGRALGYMSEFGGWIDVHGAGAQRSDQKTGDPDDYPTGHGPQGDAKRFYNFVRCVREGASFNTQTIFDSSVSQTQPTQQNPTPPSEPSQKQPPQEAVQACLNKTEGNSCTFQTPNGTLIGTCRSLPEGVFACAP